MTRVRLPTTPVPPPTPELVSLAGPVDELVGLLVSRDEPGIADRIAALRLVCHSVLVVDDGSGDDTADRAQAAGARVLRFPAPRGAGAALRAGMRLARELGYIGALLPGDPIPAPDDLKALALAHVKAPEVLVMGVGPGQALAGKEWEAALAESRGEEPEPYPDWRPPASSGLTAQLLRVFEALVETTYSYPWGGPRIVPLQGVLRRDLREPGPGTHIELLAEAVAAGIPTAELELSVPPHRPVLTCRKACVRLAARFAPRVARRRVAERLGFGGGYAPPTQSPLLLLLAASLAVLAVGCVPKKPPVAVAECEAQTPRAQWPGDGEAQAALTELLSSREATARVLVEQGVEVTDPGLQGTQRLNGVMAIDDGRRLRIRLVAMGFTVLDYLETEDAWQLTIPPGGVRRDGSPGEAVLSSADLARLQGPQLRPDLIASLVRSVGEGAQVRWQPGTCAVLEEVEDGAVVRRIGFAAEGDAWYVAREAVLAEGRERMAVVYSDYREAGGGAWPHRAEITDSDRGSLVVLTTRRLRVDGLSDEHFALVPR